MKNTLFTLIAVLFSATIITAQSMPTNPDQGFYTRIGVGYAFGQAGNTHNPWNGVYSGSRANLGTSTQQYFSSVEKVSFSSGLRAYAAGGYMINKNVGIELAADMGVYNRKYSSGFTNITSQTTGTIEDKNTTQHVHFPVILNPSVVFQSGTGLWHMYARVGIALPVFSSIDIDEDYTYTDAGGSITDYAYTESLKTSFSIGYTGALGLNYRMSDDVKLFLEASVLSLALDAKELDIKTATSNGQNIYPNLSRTTVLFKNSGTTPSEYYIYSIPFSNLSLNAGLTWSFHNHAKKKIALPTHNRQ